ncbi:hypothetical protein IE53DRAFT_388880 [Violaceomyces palustris]|uniref:Uncharacterized protein n=1 Tax=Violaceomyces palustris TaxID=1673888 RepID=A0ACD0NT27_9BASI|nr:hypothetical protein IE53DRAFT_388880 [Violaceomyces palustris]
MDRRRDQGFHHQWTKAPATIFQGASRILDQFVLSLFIFILIFFFLPVSSKLTLTVSQAGCQQHSGESQGPLGFARISRLACIPLEMADPSRSGIETSCSQETRRVVKSLSGVKPRGHLFFPKAFGTFHYVLKQYIASLLTEPIL